MLVRVEYLLGTCLLLREIYVLDGPQRPLGRRLRPQKFRDGQVDVADGAPRRSRRRRGGIGRHSHGNHGADVEVALALRVRLLIPLRAPHVHPDAVN